MKLTAHLREAGARLAGIPGLNARLEAELLLAFVLGCNRAWLYAHPEAQLGADHLSHFGELLERRAGGEPLAYITARREFWSLPLKVTPAVLIPRPETEELVSAALARLDEQPGRRAADIGTGSGAIALALASERPDAELSATDISPEALALAQENATRLKLANIHFAPGNWCEPLHGSFDLIVSNPPYVRQDDPHLLQGDCRFEPRLAVTPGADELYAFREITRQSVPLLAEGGWLLFEHGQDQGAAVRAILAEWGLDCIDTLTDLEHRERVSLGRKAAPGRQKRG